LHSDFDQSSGFQETEVSAFYNLRPAADDWFSLFREIVRFVKASVLLIALFLSAKFLQNYQMWFIMEKVQSSYTLSERLLRAISRSTSSWTYPCDDIQDLIAQGADVNQPHGQLLPLHCACVVGDAKAVKILLENGAEVDKSDGFQRSSLHYAAEKSEKCVELLLAHGADVNARDGNNSTPLHWAAYKNLKESVRLMLEHGANPDCMDYNNDTPLSWAALKGHLETIEVLLDYNCRVNTVNLNGSSPISRLLQTLVMGIGSAQEEACLHLLFKALGQFDLRERTTGRLPRDFEQDPAVRELLLYYCSSVRDLKHLCRFALRRILGPSDLTRTMDLLPLPSRLKTYVLLKE